MDWTLAIEKNREALKRILAMLVAMVGVDGGGSARGQFTFFPRTDALPQNLALAEKSKLSPALTLPRHLHRFVLRLLRPAEAAVRRLIIVAARGLVVELGPPRIREPKPIFVRNGVGTGIVLAPGRQPARARAPVRPRALSLPLLDPLKRWGGRRRVKQRSVPRITFDFDRPREPDPVPLSPDDPLDVGRLHRRLEAIGRVLDDLPSAAKRLARWQARRAAELAQDGNNRAAGVQGNHNTGRIRRPPMRPGRPPGWRRRHDHAVYEVLNELHGLAVWARERPDTS